MSKRKNFALFMAMPDNEFSINLLQGASKAAKELDANLYVFPTGLIDAQYSDGMDHKYHYQYNVLNHFINCNSIDGAIIDYGTMASRMAEDRKKDFLSLIGSVPVILLSEDAEGYHSILFDNQSGINEIVSHLIEVHGCQKIAFLAGPPANHDSIERLNAYRTTMEQHNIHLSDDWIEHGDFSRYSHSYVRNLLDRHPDVEAIVSANDDMVLSCYEVFAERNIIPGKDILVTGFDGRPSSQLMSPSLTTVKADIPLLAYKAIYAINDPANLEDTYKVPTKMIARHSCGCHPNLIYDSNGDIVGLADEQELQRTAYNILSTEEISKNFINELTMSMRDMILYQQSKERWFEAVLQTMRRLGFRRSYIFFYRDPIVRYEHEDWVPPDTVDLMAFYTDETNYTLNIKHVFNLDTLFNEDIFAADKRGDLIVTPLYYCEKQYGLLIAENDINSFQYIYSTTSQISTSLEIINIHLANEQILKELETANKYKSQFLANMSHEIRTPINAIMGMNEMILRENKDTVISDYANNIKEASSLLLSIVNDILDVTKIEAGKMTLVPVDYNLFVMVKAVMKQVAFRKKGKELDLILDYDEKMPGIMYGDDIRLRQILTNLLTNAVKYTPSGSVTLKVSGRTDGDYVDITFTVRDTGIGIKPEDMDKLFEKFERVEETRNRSIEGTGLGMSIIVGLLTLMGSRLNVESVYGEGSTFSFTIRQKIVSRTPANQSQVKADDQTFSQQFTAPDARLLLVDDNNINRMVITNLLKASQIKIDEAENGQVCVDKFMKDSYDIILLDHMMPVMDGLEALANIRKTEKYQTERPAVIALTAHALDGMEQEYKNAGFDDYLSKPVSPAKLDSTIIKFLAKDKLKMNEQE